jgi:membrane protein DedA with SNARE-associated domain
MKKIGLIVLGFVTLNILGATPIACSLMAVGENIAGVSDHPGYFYLWSLVPLAVITAIWVLIFVCWVLKRATPKFKRGH